MKKAIVVFERVMDCPYYMGGECWHKENDNGCIECGYNKPPEHCPLEDCEEQ